LAGFDGVPHLLAPVVTDVRKTVGVLRQAISEMERRYDLFARGGFRNIETFNRKATASSGKVLPLPYIVVIIDELADLMMVSPDEVETLICRLAQMARATGIHLIIATQRPSVDVVTGLIKANFPSRISFAVTSQIDSRVILDMAGAEKLLGRGDMLFTTAEMAKPIRVQGTYVSDNEIEAMVGFWKGVYEPQYEKEFVELPAYEEEQAGGDKLIPEAVKLVRQHSTASVSMLQRKLRIGYNRAASIMDQLEERGVVVLGEDGRTWEVAPEETEEEFVLED
jgi:DNA segregation ATPase FtsK/SpoIIIE, S-DNA-T family